MDDVRWEQLFDILDELVHKLPGLAWEEKSELVKQKAKVLNAEHELWEFVSWFND